MSKLTHLDDKGQARMVDVSAKDVTTRLATAQGRITMTAETLAMITEGRARKGAVLAAARIAGMMSAKKTHELIPLCHPLLISGVSVEFTPDVKSSSIEIEATVKVEGKTGVEMEALTAVSVACLTIYDMCKSADRAMRIGDIRLVEKSGGKSGHYSAG
jgi:cyclic pyranopterin phosphate synthase